MHASMFGIELTKTRIDALNRTAGVHFAQFDYSGIITAEGQIALAQHALWGAIKLAMSLSFVWTCSDLAFSDCFNTYFIQSRRVG